jgi:tetratricopeptide (TPR) repeat protein
MKVGTMLTLVREPLGKIYILFCAFILGSQSAVFAQVTGVEQNGESLIRAQQECDAFPKDAKRHFELAEALRSSHDIKKAAAEFLNVTRLDPGYYLAYHQMVLSKPTVAQLDEAIERLNTLEKEKPSVLMLRVSLSEMLEKKGEYYKAARTLVDIEYSHTIPEKYLPRINGRIHYLLMKAKDTETLDEAKKPEAQSESDSSPLPLPDASLDSDLSSTKLKGQSVTESYGHARLLP